jgi:hypothetical protein
MKMPCDTNGLVASSIQKSDTRIASIKKKDSKG